MEKTNTIDRLQQRSIQLGIFLVGLAAMCVSGWYLIEGMLRFAGDSGSNRVFVAAGLIFQITESICFILAAALVSKSLSWRLAFIGLGSVLFLFSISVMTLAQKATLQAGEFASSALNENIASLQAQVESLDEMIASYRFNAEKQSKSIYANSRELGQDSLNRATELELKKLELSEKLFQLNSQRRQTSSDFFKQVEQIIDVPALQAEFYFLVTRSLLLELCGILLMSYAAYLHAPIGVSRSTTVPSPPVVKRPQSMGTMVTASADRATTRKATPAAENTSRKQSGWHKTHLQLIKEGEKGGRRPEDKET